MNQSYHIYPDKIRIFIIVFFYLIIVGGMCWVLIISSFWIIKVLALIFIILFLMLIFETVDPVINKKELYLINNEGIYEYSPNKYTKSRFVSWSDIIKIELVPNNSTMQIGIISTDVVESSEKQMEMVKTNLNKNGNFSIFTIKIDGFKFRRKQFLEIYKKLCYFAGKNNPNILINKYKGIDIN